jgi:hypothetical protein
MAAVTIMREIGVVCGHCSTINRLYSTDQIIFQGHGRLTQPCRGTKCGRLLSVYVDFRS